MRERVVGEGDDGIAGEAAGSAAVADGSVGDLESNGSAAGWTQLGSHGHRTPVAPLRQRSLRLKTHPLFRRRVHSRTPLSLSSLFSLFESRQGHL